MKSLLSLDDFIRGIPKAELHVHIEGTFEPELMFEIAKRNNIQLKYKSVEEIREAYNFNNLQDFLNIYYDGAGVLITEEDFYDLTNAYLEKAHKQNILHSEIFFDPQTHTQRGIPFSTVVNGINRALNNARDTFGISTKLILCFLRDLDESDAMNTLEEALKYKNYIIAVGLDSSEVGHPPSKFQRVFSRAREEGFLTVAHAGEEGPSEYIREALNLLKVSRIDHGNHSLDDDSLIDTLAAMNMPLTICPLSNLKLKVIQRMELHPLREMLQRRLLVTINSDDPAYFGGYLNENYLAAARALSMTKQDIHKLAHNSFRASFLNESEKQQLFEKTDKFMADYGHQAD